MQLPAFAGPPDKDFDPPHFLDEVLNLDSSDCALNLLRVAGKQYKSIASPLYQFLHHKLIKEKTLHSEMGLLEIDPKRAQNAGVDLEDLERDRANVRRYLPGLLYDVVLSRVAGFVGVAAGARTRGSFDHAAAQDYFLSWQRPALNNVLDFEGKLRLKLSTEFFPGFISFKRLAAEMVISGDDDEKREEVLMDTLRMVLKSLKHFLLPELYEYQITEHFGVGLNRGWAARVFHKHRGYVSYTWHEEGYKNGVLVQMPRTLYYRRVRNDDSRAPRLLMQTFSMPATGPGVASLITSSVDMDRYPLGVVLTLPEELGQTLLTFVSRLHETFAANSVWDPRGDPEASSP